MSIDEILANPDGLGLALLAFVVINKLVDIVTAYVKQLVEERKAKPATAVDIPTSPQGATDRDLLKKVGEQSDANGRLLLDMKEKVDKLTKVVIDGNGRPGLIEQIAVISERLAAHITDDDRHGNRRGKSR